MSEWKLEPDAIYGIVTDVLTEAGDLQVAIKPHHAEAVETGLGWGGGVLAPLREAVVDYAGMQGERLVAIGALIYVGVGGLSRAVRTYNNANEEMFERVQERMLEHAGSPITPIDLPDRTH